MATFAGGCFWCTEAVFKRLKGIKTVVSGYTGGDPSDDGESPSYDQVSTGATGHAEAIQVTFNPQIVSYKKLLEVFFKTHDPTTLNRQGADIGTQYRSTIFYHNDEQKKLAEELIKTLEEGRAYKDPIVTNVEKYTVFYPAEANHQNFYENNKDYAYCTVVIDPKINKLLKEFSQDVKDEYKTN